MVDVWFWFWIGVLLLCAIIVLGFIIFEMRYKHRVIIRQLTNNRKYIIVEKAREIIDKNKVTWWKLRKERDKVKKFMPVPPSDSIDITKRGKFWHETYRTAQGEYVPIIDESKIGDIPEWVKEKLKVMPPEISAITNEHKKQIEFNKWKNRELQEYRLKNNIVQPIKPFTREQRMAMTNQIEKAKLDLNMDWKRDLPFYVSVGFIAILLVAGLIFAPDIISTYTTGKKETLTLVNDLDARMHERRMEEINQFETLIRGVQQIQEANQEYDKRLDELEKRDSNG